MTRAVGKMLSPGAALRGDGTGTSLTFLEGAPLPLGRACTHLPFVLFKDPARALVHTTTE